MHKNSLEELKKWFLSQSRDLPWREFPSPYSVWISEVMLQQTQVSVVIAYFERWMKQFPSIRKLAEAPVEEVLKAWEGLGYYSRARNLHEGAQYIFKHFNGELPSSPEQLIKIKGIGTYTLNAILSFAFHQRRAAVDGNVLRVLARYHCLPDDISKASSLKKIQYLADQLLPEEEPWVISEALIELGATVCNRKPNCFECPLKKTCQSHLKGVTEQFPFKSTKVTTTSLYRAVAVIAYQGELLVKKGLTGKVMADLFEFPYFEELNQNSSYGNLSEKIQKEFGFEISWQASLSQVKHSFTRYRALLMPHFFTVNKKNKPVNGYEWLSIETLSKLPFSSGHRRIFHEIQTQLQTK